jgi:hypothetical protein
VIIKEVTHTEIAEGAEFKKLVNKNLSFDLFSVNSVDSSDCKERA